MIYLLDTNVVTELRKIGDGKADANVVAWIDAEDAVSFYISAITNLELERGIHLCSAGTLRRALACVHGSTIMCARNSLDEAIATRCAHLHIPDRRNEADALIAATALVHGMTVVTRNFRDFEGTGVVIVDPWQG